MTYFIEQQHSGEECLKALDELAERGPSLLDKSYLACNAGEHRGYAFVEAGSEYEAREMVPTALREQARVIRVDRFTPEQIRSFHQK